MTRLSGTRYRASFEDDEVQQEETQTEAVQETTQGEGVGNEEGGSEITVRREGIIKQEELLHVDAVSQVERGEANLRQLGTLPLPVDVTSVESFNVFVPGGDFMTKFGGWIEGFTNTIRGSFTEIMQKVTNINLGDGDYTKLLRHAQQHNYFSLAKTTKLYQPNKLGAYWLDYAKWLRATSGISSTIDRDILAPMQEYLARCINDPNLLTSNAYKPKYVMKDIETLQKEMQKIFNGPTTEKVVWSKAFRNNNEVPEFLNIMQEIKRNIDLLSPETVNKSVNLLSDRANIIAKNIKDKDSRYQLNAKQTKHISDMLYVCARYVEMYSVVIQLFYELEQCIIISSEKLR